MEEPVQFKIWIDPKIKAAFEAVAEKQLTDNTKAGARLLKWFSEQDEGVQAMILGQVRGRDAELLARAILRSFVKAPKSTGRMAIIEGGKGRVVDRPMDRPNRPGQ